MATPLPPEILTPEGIPAFLNPYKGTYTTSRSYALRMQRAFARGLSQSEARGHAATGALTESQWRRLRLLYVDEINGRSWHQGPRHMNIDIEGNRNDPRIFKTDADYIVRLFDGGYRDPAVPSIGDALTYLEWRLSERLNAIIEFQDFRNPVPGRQDYYARSSVWPQGGMWIAGGLNVAAGPPLEFWYYH